MPQDRLNGVHDVLKIHVDFLRSVGFAVVFFPEVARFFNRLCRPYCSLLRNPDGPNWSSRWPRAEIAEAVSLPVTGISTDNPLQSAEWAYPPSNKG